MLDKLAKYSVGSIWPGIYAAPASAAEWNMVTLPAGGPSFQFRADTVTLSSGNVATIPNRRGADALVVSAGTLAAPAGDALFGGAQSIAFTGTQWLDSNLPASAWKFLHDGTGCEVFHVLSPTSAAAFFFGTRPQSAAAETGLLHYFITASTGVAQSIGNGSANIMNTGAGACPANTAYVFDAYYSETQPLKYTLFRNEAAVTQNTVMLGAPSAGAPNTTARLGAAPTSGGNPANMRWCETLIFPRVLHEYERQIVREYIAARYGIAAPSLTGAYRDIMSMLPFSFPAADTYNTSGGKVTSFLDRARPGHTFAQGTVGAQVVNPTVDAALGGKLVAVSTGNERYDSSLAASAWSFLSGAGGCQSYFVYKPTATTGAFMYSTGDSVVSLDAFGAGTSVRVICRKAASTAFYFASGFGTQAVNTPTIATVKHATALTPDAYGKMSGQAASTMAYALTPDGSTPQFSLRLFGRATVGSGMVGTWAAMPIFDRLLTADEEARMSANLFELFGVTP